MTTEIHCTYTGNGTVEIHKDGTIDVLHTRYDDTTQHVSPGSMLLAALGACTLSMLSTLAAKHGQNFDGVKLDMAARFAEDGAGLQTVHIRLTLPPGTDEAMRRRYLAAAEICPVHNSLRTDIQYTIEAN